MAVQRQPEVGADVLKGDRPVVELNHDGLDRLLAEWRLVLEAHAITGLDESVERDTGDLATHTVTRWLRVV
jgi:hypothetical protein